MAVTGLDTWYLIAAMDNRFQWWRFDRAAYADEIDEIVDRCALWWYRHITCGDPPPSTGRDHVRRAQTGLRPFLDHSGNAATSTPGPLSHMVEVPGLADLDRPQPA